MLKLLYLVGFNVGESMVTSDNSAIVRAGHIDFLWDNPLRGASHNNLQAFWNTNFQYLNSDEAIPFLTYWTDLIFALISMHFYVESSYCTG